MSSADDSDAGAGTASYDEAVDGRAVAHDALADVEMGGSSAFPVDVPGEVHGPGGGAMQRKTATKIRTAPIPPARTRTPSTAELATGRHGWRRVAIDTRPLRHAAYRRMFVGSATSFFGTQLTAVAVPVQMYAMTKSNAWVGVLGVAGLVPLLIFSLWGGALADRLDRRRLLLVSSTLMWLVTLSLLAQAVLKVNSPWLLLGLVAVQSAAVAVTMPTRSAIIPRIVPADEMAQANTLNFTMSNVATVAGPLLAGVLIGTGGGVFWAYAADALTFTVALWAALRLPAMPPVGEVSDKRGGWSDVLFGLRYLGTTPVLLLSFAVDIAAMALALPRALFPAVADNEFARRRRMAVQRDRDRRRGGRCHLGLGRPRPPPGHCADLRRRGVGHRGGGGRPGPSAVAGRHPPRRRRRGRPGQLGLPPDDVAHLRAGRAARPAAGRVHRRGGRRSAPR